MKPDNTNIEYKRLLKLIERYFEGETTLAEERCLRGQLADTTFEGEEIDEARAVMGIFAVARRQSGYGKDSETPSPRRRVRRPFPPAAVSAAASIAVIIVAVLAIMHPAGISEGEMMAAASSDVYDSIAKIKSGESINGVAGHRMLAMSSARINQPDTPDEIAALISSEMGLMAEAERSVYDSVADDFTSLRDISLGDADIKW